jgi:hypothetical protein
MWLRNNNSVYLVITRMNENTMNRFVVPSSAKSTLRSLMVVLLMMTAATFILLSSSTIISNDDASSETAAVASVNRDFYGSLTRTDSVTATRRLQDGDYQPYPEGTEVEYEFEDGW